MGENEKCYEWSGDEGWEMGGDKGTGVDKVLGLLIFKEDDGRGEGISAMDTIDRLHR